MDLQKAFNIIDGATSKAELTRDNHIVVQQALNVFRDLITSVIQASNEVKKEPEVFSAQNSTLGTVENPQPLNPVKKEPEAGEGN